MESEKTKSILPLDYDEDDSEEEEEEEELFDNSKVDWRVKGNLLRGKDFTVSNNGHCPRCQSNIFVFVILDELFPMGDMPEILYNLLAKGKAVLWSSQDKQACKKPPTFMCKGFCPADPLGAGFNINWDTVNLTKLLKDLLKLNMAKAQKELHLKEKGDIKGEKSKARRTHLYDDEEDVDEKDIIRVMLAKEKEKEDDEEEEETKLAVVAETITEDVKTETSTSPEEQTVSKPTTVATVSTTQTLTTTAASNVEYPISKDGSCPYCSSKDVRYIILIKESNKEASLPPTLESLLKQGKAFKMAKGASNTPSFQCRSCKYGFNLDWSATNLQKIFELDQPGAVVTTAATMTTSVAYQFPNYAPPMYQQPAVNHYTGYAPYGYPPMYYPPPTMPYAYPPAAYGIPPTGVPPMQAMPPPYACGGPLRNPLPTGLPPSGGPQMYRMPPGNPGMQPNVAHNMPPQATGYANPYGHQGNYNQVPLRPPQMAARLRVPRGPLRGRRNNRNLRWISPQDHQMYNYHDTHEQWSSYTEGEARCNEDTEGTTEEVREQPPLDPQAANRFEELLNQIDGKTENVDEAREDEKPPGEESQAEFEVTPFATTVQEKTKEQEKAERNGSGEQNVPSDTMNSVSNAQPENDPSRPEKISAEVKSQEEVSAGDVDSISNSEQPQNIYSDGLNTQSQEPSQDRTSTRSEETPKDDKYELEMESKPNDSSGKESIQNSTTSAESEVVEEAEESPATASRKTKPRSRKRQSAGKKKAANTRVSKRKKVEKEPEEGNSEFVDENSSPVMQESAEPQNNGGNVEEKAAEEETKTVRRMTRARAQKLKN